MAVKDSYRDKNVTSYRPIMGVIHPNVFTSRREKYIRTAAEGAFQRHGDRSLYIAFAPQNPLDDELVGHAMNTERHGGQTVGHQCPLNRIFLSVCTKYQILIHVKCSRDGTILWSNYGYDIQLTLSKASISRRAKLLTLYA